MNRIKDYTDFAAWFCGLGYIVLWPLASPDSSGKPFGASIYCHDGAPALLDFLCNSVHPLRLPPALHAIGLMSVAFVAVRLSLWAIGRWRRARRAVAIDMSAVKLRLPAAPPPPPLSRPPVARPPLPTVNRRSHFGLRGMPQ